MRVRREDLARTVEQTSDLVVLTDPDGRIAYANPAFQSITGYDPQDVIGSSLEILGSRPLEGGRGEAPGESPLPESLLEGRVVSRRIDDSLFVEDRRVSRLEDEEGALRGWVVTGRDITEQVDLERRMRQIEKRDVVGRLSGRTAHAFANIFTVVSSGLELIRREVQEGSLARVEHRVRQVIQAADVGARLVDQLLALSYGHVERPQPVDLNRFVTESADILRYLVPESVSLSIRCPSDLPAWTHIDPPSLSQIILSLTMNAAEALREPGRITIVVQGPSAGRGRGNSGEREEGKPGKTVELRVRDTGPGMPSYIQEQIFEPFFTTKNDAPGLGLTRAAETARTAGGRIRVDSERGKGTTMTLVLPYRPPDDGPDGAQGRGGEG